MVKIVIEFMYLEDRRMIVFRYLLFYFIKIVFIYNG